LAAIWRKAGSLRYISKVLHAKYAQKTTFTIVAFRRRQYGLFSFWDIHLQITKVVSEIDTTMHKLLHKLHLRYDRPIFLRLLFAGCQIEPQLFS